MAALYHYTDIPGIMGIVQGKSLWLSSVASLSDSKEVGYALDVVLECLRQKFFYIQEGYTDEASIYVGNLRKLIGVRTDYFVASLTESGDLLSQWLIYAKQGSGAAIYFQEEPFLTHAARCGLEVYRCIYDRDEHIRLASNFITSLSERFPAEKMLRIDPRIGFSESSDQSNDFRANSEFNLGIFNEIRDFVHTQGLAFKNPVFKEERELRLVYHVSMSDNRIKFRARGNTIVPYIEHDISEIFSSVDGSIKFGCVFGPNCDRRTTQVSMQIIISRASGITLGTSFSAAPEIKM